MAIVSDRTAARGDVYPGFARQHGAGVVAAGVARGAAEHPRDFGDARFVVQRGNAGLGGVVVAVFFDAVVRVGVGGDLWQVGDAQYLPVLAEGVQQAANGVGDFAADAGVDFVEDDGRRWRRGFVEAGDFDGEADAREFAAGGDFGERLQGLTGVGAEGVGDVVVAVRGGAGSGLDVNGEGGFFHAELAYPLFDVARECWGGLLSRGAQGGGFGVVVGLCCPAGGL